MGWLLMSANLSFAAISTTQQNFDDFSFKKGFKATGGLSFSNEFRLYSKVLNHGEMFKDENF